MNESLASTQAPLVAVASPPVASGPSLVAFGSSFVVIDLPSRSQPLTPTACLAGEALLVARAAGQIDRAPVASQIDDVLIHEGPGRRIAFVT